MAIEQVKIPKNILVRARAENPQMKIVRGRIGLFSGAFAKIKIWASKGEKPLILFRRGQGGKWTCERKFSFCEITLANDTARRLEMQGNDNGAKLGTLSSDEQTAIRIWRNYAYAATSRGESPRTLSETIRELVEREETKDETPFFENAAFDFLVFKEKRAALSESYYVQIKSRLKALSCALKGKRLAQIHEGELESAILNAVSPRRSREVAPKTLKHWLALAREVFAWWFSRENAKRSARDKLTNPLETLAFPKIEKEAEPEIYSLSESRALLAELWRSAPEIVPAVAVQMFCGVRNAEALRLRWRDIIEGEIRLSCAITKTKVSRSVAVPENLKAWFEACALRSGVPARDALIYAGKDAAAEKLATLDKDARKREEYEAEQARRDAYGRALRAAFERAKITKKQNAFRHTAASCMVKIYGEAAAATFCGHSTRTQAVFYRTAVSSQDAKGYFGIMPPQGDGKAIAFSREGAKDRATGARDGQRDAAQGETGTPDTAASA